MKHSRLWVAATIIALAVIIGFVFSVPHTRDVVKTPSSEGATTSVPLVSLSDSFKKGVHTITGSIEVSNICTILSAQAASSTEGILVEISMPSDTGVCLQLPTRATFQTTLSAPADLPFTVTVNGSPATTTML
jgi:hypothetical protein